MLLTQLEYFDALARERHFGRAAASCFVTTSTMSEAVRKLEAELGVPLVNRGRSSFRDLTPEGELLLTHIRRILADRRRLVEDLTAAGGNLSTTLRLGTVPSGDTRAAAVIARLTTAHPGVRVEVSTGIGSADLVEKLRSHDLDAAVIHPVDDIDGAVDLDGLALTPMEPVRYAVVLTEGLVATLGPGLGPSHGPDAGRDRISAVDLARLPVALLSPGMLARTCFDRAMTSVGVSVAPTVESGSVASLTALAATGRWAAVVPVGTPGVTSGDLRLLPLVDPVVEIPAAVARLATRPVTRLGTAVDNAATGADTADTGTNTGTASEASAGDMR
jgi:DNA-binding transcriptional LysR family regulator